MYTICLVEDEIDLSNLIKIYLEKENYKVIQFFKGKDALDYIKENVHLWILDIMLADDVTGYDIIKEIRKKDSNIPVVFTSARDQGIDRIIGLELGSDDYLSKPYSPKELVLRVNRIVGRVYKSSNDDLVKYAEYNIDISKRVAYVGEEEIKLTTLEFDLLVLLVTNLNKTFGREDILKNVWGEDYFGSDRAVDDLVRRLRKKMPKLNVSTVYGYGYRLT